VTVVDQLESIWSGLLELTSRFVIPDWGALIGLLPVFILVLVIGPIVSLLVLLWIVYVLRAPRVGVLPPDEAARTAPIGADGLPAFPPGEPYCFRDGIIYPARATRCEVCGDELAVACPKCGVGRAASVETCANCGLVLKVEPRAVALRPAGPPPGGAAAA
jgi:hypothetical protein